MRRPALVLTLWLGLAATPIGARVVAAQVPRRARLGAAIDSIALAPIRAGKVAGMSVAVVRGRDTIRMRGYGFADLEFDVPTPDRAIYEIGSVTKQFTAAAILQLVERGLVRLDADVTEYLPGYPSHGARISIRQLLNHTSGIHNYTDIPSIHVLMRQQLPRDSIVAVFKELPLDFPPGDRLSYTNSAFFLLGMVIERVTGRPYAEYVRDSLFHRAGMADSRYCSENAVVRRRAHGYDMDSTGLVRAAYLDQVWPFSAGSLCSTVGDLVAWTRALHHGGILGPAAYRELITPDTLNDGTRLRYAKGLAVAEAGGHLVIGHGGAINGFLSELRYYPEADLTIVVLMNTLGPVGPGSVVTAIADRILPPRPPAPRALDVAPQLLAGTYRGSGPDSQTVVTIAGDSLGLTARVDTGAVDRLTYLGDLKFADGRTVYRFARVGDAITAVRRDAVYANAEFRREGAMAQPARP